MPCLYDEAGQTEKKKIILYTNKYKYVTYREKFVFFRHRNRFTFTSFIPGPIYIYYILKYWSVRISL